MMKRKLIWLLIWLPAFVLSHNASAQFYSGSQMTFGKNRIQYNDERIWSQFRFEAFDFIFYQEGRKITINAAKYAYTALDEISQKLNYKPESKIHFIVFNTLSEMKSSNIGLDNEVLYNTGGITNVVDNKVFLYFDGSYLNLEQQIRAGIARVIINYMLYGEQLVSNIKNSTLMALPDWYINGLVSYLSQDWSTSLDERFRDGILNRNFKKFNHLEGADATLAGHAVWKYVVDRYGAAVIPNVIYMTKVSRNVESGFLFVLGVSFKNLISEWYNYNFALYTNDVAGRNTPPESNVPVKIRKKNFYYQAKVSPDERYLTYAFDKVNKKKLFLLDRNSGKKKKLYRLGTKMDDIADMSFPVTAWHPTSSLFAWVIEKKGRRVLYLYNLDDKTREDIYIDNLNKVLDMAYSPDGSVLVMSAVVNGYSDIFLFYPGSKSFTRVTNDIYDDLTPRFIDNNLIAFSSNRISDTLELEKETYLIDYSDTIEKQSYYDVFAYDTKSKSPALRRITETPFASEMSPMPADGKEFTWLSDENGIQNKMIGHFDSAIAYVDTTVHYRYFTTMSASTDLNTGIREMEFYRNSSLGTMVFTVGNKSQIVVLDKNLYQTDVSEAWEKPTAWATERNITRSAAAEKKDVLPESKGNSTQKQGYVKSGSDSSGVNVYNYKFSVVTSKPAGTTKANQQKMDTVPAFKFVLPKQQNYDVEYGIDKLVSQLDFSFLNTTYQPYNGLGPIYGNSGSNAFFQLGASDLLEDKRIVGGVKLALNLDNNEYFISYEDMSRRLDRQMVFHRMSYDVITETAYIKHHLQDFNYIFKWPFSPVLAVKATAIIKYDNQVYKSVNDYNLEHPDENSLWAGSRLELVFDNTRSPMKNILFGLRYKIFSEYYQGINKNKLNLITAGFDFRHYTRIHRTFIWANRIAFGTSFGSTRLLYFLGGTDNIFLPSFNYNQPVDPNMNFAFQTLATNMRGFPQNVRNGNSFAVINSELRMPLFRYILNRPIKSEFINNFQIVGFGDLGSAWLGLNPYSEENVMVPHTYYQRPILVTVKEPRNPLVGGLGAGLRTTLMGYFVRFDVAWGIEEMKVSKPRYVLSFSLDF